MRRIALIAVLLGAVVTWVTSLAGASDSHTYHVEMYNAFGVVNGSNVRIAGVDTGTVTDLGITPDKRADVTIETSGPLGTLGKDTRCASEPQSLIAEYFITCNPKGPPLADGGTIPASHVTETVQPDLVQNTLREPYKDRLSILINEFGTALAGNPKELNQAISLGSPALRKLQAALRILASENRTIRDLNANSDTVITQLANKRQDVISFIQHARDVAAISASRRDDLSTDFNRLDDFLAQLKPTLTKLGTLADAQTPLLTNLKLAAPGLNTLAQKLPAFNDATNRSLTSAHPGQGRDSGAGEVGQERLPGDQHARQVPARHRHAEAHGRDRPARSAQLRQQEGPLLVHRPQGPHGLHRHGGPPELPLLPGGRHQPVRPVRARAARSHLRPGRPLRPGLQRGRQPGRQQPAARQPRHRCSERGRRRDDHPARRCEPLRVVARRQPARYQPEHRLAAVRPLGLSRWLHRPPAL
jgi:virulence factor Mce-like protein